MIAREITHIGMNTSFGFGKYKLGNTTIMYNILINNLSLVSTRAEQSSYRMMVEEWENRPDVEKTFKGIHTNEPVAHALIRKFANEEEGEKLDAILSLTTEKVQDALIFPDGAKKSDVFLDMMTGYLCLEREVALRLTHYGFYKELIKKITMEEYLLETEQEYEEIGAKMEWERIPNIPKAADVHRAVISMANKIISLYRENDGKCRLYLDYTGGDRTASTILIALTKMLEERGINVDHIWAVNFDQSETVHEVHEKIEVNYIFDFISGIYEFTNYGRADGLNSFLEKSEKKGMLCLSEQAKAVQEKVNALADEIQLCRSREIVDGIGRLVNAIKKYEKESMGSNVLFDYLIDDIKNNYRQIYAPAQRTIPNIINWCLDKKLIQQAVTMYTELIPAFIVENRILFYDRSNWEKIPTKRFHIYNNEVQNFIQNGTTDIEELGRLRIPKTKSYRDFAEEYSYINYYIWYEIGENKALYKWDGQSGYLDNCDKKIQAIVDYIYGPDSPGQFVQRDPHITKSGLKSLLKNYFIFKNRVRVSLNHATAERIKISDIRGNMVWRDESIFECVEGVNDPDLSVKLLTAMMYDLLRQLDDIMKK